MDTNFTTQAEMDAAVIEELRKIMNFSKAKQARRDEVQAREQTIRRARVIGELIASAHSR